MILFRVLRVFSWSNEFFRFISSRKPPNEPREPSVVNSLSNHPDRPTSLRRRLLLLLLSMISLVWGLAGYIAWSSSHHEVDEVMDTQLANSAELLLTLTRHELEEALEDPEEIVEFRKLEEFPVNPQNEEYRIAFQIYDHHGHLLLASPNAPAKMAPGLHNQFEDHWYNGRGWRGITYQADVGAVVVAMPLEPREEMVDYILLNSLWPIPVSLIIVALLVWWAVGRGLAPLDQVAGELAQRDSEDLSHLPDQQTPKEIRPLVDALNRLLGRLSHTLENERRFTADAAHELRTPLTAIKIQAEVAQRAQEPQRRARALEQITQGIDRTTHLVEQLLTLARADTSRAHALERKQLDLAALVRQEMAQQAPEALEKQLQLEFDNQAEGLRIQGDPKLLAVLLRNLINNAVKYARPDGQILVSIQTQEHALRLSVADNGPGIPPEQRQQLFERFKRGNQQVAGSGLGLSIVKRITELHQTTIRLEDGLNGEGLGVVLEFPLP
jgi:two-component system sensor histidine kinase QseC